MNMTATMAPKWHIIFDRAVDWYAVVIKWIVTKWSATATETTLLHTKEVEAPPKHKIKLSVKPKRKVKLELWWEITLMEIWEEPESELEQGRG